MADIHAGDDSDHEDHEDDYYQILMPIGKQFLWDPLDKGISHACTSLPLELGSRYLLVVDVVMAYDAVS